MSVVTYSRSPFTNASVPSNGSTHTHKSLMSYSVLTTVFYGHLSNNDSEYLSLSTLANYYSGSLCWLSSPTMRSLGL